jgi:hypothetical protein
MARVDRGYWIAAALALVSGSAMAERAPPVSQPIIGIVEATGGGWNQLGIVDVAAFPHDAEFPRFRTKSKTIFKGPKVGALVYTVFDPPWNARMPPPGMRPHYHHFHEWGYTLQGDSVLIEPVSPYQKNGMKYWKPQGGWLDRPAYSLHGGSWETGGGLRAQTPYHLLIYEEGDGSIVTIGPNGDHFKPDFPDKPEPYDPDWRAVKQWTRPWLVDTAHDLEWETDREVPGRFVKWLSDDQQQGFRAQLVKIPPGWTPPAGSAKTYFQHANRMRYMLHGDMQIWLFDGPEDRGRQVSVAENFFIYQPPRSLWGYGDGPVSENGAFWLEVTYARGLEVGGGPIEAPIRVNEE